MRIPCPNPQLSHVECEILLKNGQKSKMRAGGGLTVEVDDDAIEVLMRSYDNQGRSAQHAWTKEDGIQTMKLFLQNRELRKKIAAYEDKQKRSAASVTQKKREAKREDVPAAKELPKSESKD